ncbi:MAG: patatin-like phospholipase family protein [Candidatus Margulisbacteria bacterium]|jgi:NTE family protein|nr:patatin-like phospholipase family protein [Candidatus Margulisiibacteriota bacterium]
MNFDFLNLWPFRQPKIGLALGGGSMRGLANVGILKGLAKHGVPIHCISGTSAGSIAAALYAAGQTAAEIEEIVLGLDWFKIASLSLSGRGMLNPAKLQKYLDALLPVKTFGETKIPLHISASDLLTAQEYVFEQPDEEIAFATAVSCSIPGDFSPSEYRGRYLVDGCLVNNIPLSALAIHRPTVYIGVNVIPRGAMPEKPRNIFQIFSRGYDIYELSNLARYQKYKPLLLEPLKAYVKPELKPGKDFYRKLIQAGEAEIEKQLPRLKKLAQVK